MIKRKPWPSRIRSPSCTAGTDRNRLAASALRRPTRRFTATFLGLTNLIEGKVLEVDGDSRPGKMQTKKGILSFIPAPGLKKDQAAVISIRPENIPVHKEKPQSLDNVVEGTVKEAIFMGDAYHCKVAVGDDLWLCIPIHFTASALGEGLPPFDPKELQWLTCG